MNTIARTAQHPDHGLGAIPSVDLTDGVNLTEQLTLHLDTKFELVGGHHSSLRGSDLEDAIEASGLSFQNTAREALDLKLASIRGELAPAADAALVHSQNLRSRGLGSVVVDDIRGFHSSDYGLCHMGIAIHFDYEGATLPVMSAINDRGLRIRARRKELGFTRQADVAEEVGVDQSTMSDIENGKGFSAEVLMKLCKALKQSPDEIMFGVKPAVPASAPEAELLEIFRSMPPEARGGMLTMFRAMAPGSHKGIPKSGESSRSLGENSQSRKAA